MIGSQASLLDAPAKATDRLFFAFFPPPAVARIAHARGLEVKQSLGLHGAVVREDRIHLTLHHLGDYAGLPPGLAERAIRAGSAASSGPVEISVDRLCSFGGAVVIRGSEHALIALFGFQKHLGLAMAGVGLGKTVEKRFVPHVTFLYDHTPIPERSIEPLTFVANELVLVHSLLGLTQHRVLARWPLQST